MSRSDKKIMRTSHASKDIGAQGSTLIQRIERQMDKRRKAMEDLVIQDPTVIDGNSPGALNYLLQKGRYEGLGAALAILRSSSVPQEISRSNERLGIE